MELLGRLITLLDPVLAAAEGHWGWAFSSKPVLHDATLSLALLGILDGLVTGREVARKDRYLLRRELLPRALAI